MENKKNANNFYGNIIIIGISGGLMVVELRNSLSKINQPSAQYLPPLYVGNTNVIEEKKHIYLYNQGKRGNVFYIFS